MGFPPQKLTAVQERVTVELVTLLQPKEAAEGEVLLVVESEDDQNT